MLLFAQAAEHVMTWQEVTLAVLLALVAAIPGIITVVMTSRQNPKIEAIHEASQETVKLAKEKVVTDALEKTASTEQRIAVLETQVASGPSTPNPPSSTPIIS